MKNSKKEKRTNRFVSYLKYVGSYIAKNYKLLILFLFGFGIISVINFFQISTKDTISSFSLEEFEVGMISDRTIIADRTLLKDDVNPVDVKAGEKIIKKGFPITEEAYAQLKKMSASPQYIDYRAYANSEIYMFIITILWYLMYSFMPYQKKKNISEPVLEMIFVILVYGCVSFGQKWALIDNPYSICVVIPAVLFSILITILYGQLPAILLSCVMSLFVLGAFGLEGGAIIPFLYTLVTSLVSTAIVRKIDRRMDLIFAAIVLAIFNIVFMTLLIVIFNETFVFGGVVYIGIVVNAFLTGILALGILTPLEFVLNTASVFRLMDLSDLNNPLMRKMLVNASGTYQHSMMVAQLAENACREIGANSLIARVGAYYHDIGKIDQSEYFVENQKGENIHNTLNPTLSVSVIKSHVKKGVEKAHQLHLPSVIIDIIAEHHGNSVIAYFYNEAKEKDPTLSPEDFAYKGTPPSSRESAVVMLADTVEAACRTLEKPSVTRLEKFITTLINSKVEHNQMDNCDLTFRDITKIKDAFVQILAGYYHSRIEYPDQKDPDQKNENRAEPSAEENAGEATEDKTITAESISSDDTTLDEKDAKTKKSRGKSKSKKTSEEKFDEVEIDVIPEPDESK